MSTKTRQPTYDPNLVEVKAKVSITVQCTCGCSDHENK